MKKELTFTARVITGNKSIMNGGFEYKFIVRGINILDATDNLIKYLQEGSIGTVICSIRVDPVDTKLTVIQI